jgi:hypothetical protein
MLQAHTLLWNYLWVAPNVLLLLLSLLLWKRGTQGRYPVFVVFGTGTALVELALFTADQVPAIGPRAFWIGDFAGLVIEGVLKFILIGEIFAQLLRPYPSLARVGRFVIRYVGAAIIMGSAIVAAVTPKDGLFSVVAAPHLLQQTIFFIESGLLLLIFGTAFYFHLSLNRPTLGITLGLGVSSCVHLATWAVMASGGLPEKRAALDILNMTTYHACVLLWIYYLLIPHKAAVRLSPPPPPSHNLDEWNRELDRLLHP